MTALSLLNIRPIRFYCLFPTGLRRIICIAGLLVQKYGKLPEKLAIDLQIHAGPRRQLDCLTEGIRSGLVQAVSRGYFNLACHIVARQWCEDY